MKWSLLFGLGTLSGAALYWLLFFPHNLNFFDALWNGYCGEPCVPKELAKEWNGLAWRLDKPEWHINETIENLITLPLYWACVQACRMWFPRLTEFVVNKIVSGILWLARN